MFNLWGKGLSARIDQEMRASRTTPTTKVSMLYSSLGAPSSLVMESRNNLESNQYVCLYVKQWNYATKYRALIHYPLVAYHNYGRVAILVGKSSNQIGHLYEEVTNRWRVPW